MPSTLFFLDCHDGLEAVCRAGGLFLDDDDIPSWRRAVTKWGLPGDRLAAALEVISAAVQCLGIYPSHDSLKSG